MALHMSTSALPVGSRPPCSALRVISLLPSATENVCVLLDFCRVCRVVDAPSAPLPELVGRSHECDYPSDASVQSLPTLTAPRTAFTNSRDVHGQVRAALATASSLYHLHAAKLTTLKPDVILTQSSCRVCSIDLASVETALQGGEEASGHAAVLDDLVAAPDAPHAFAGDAETCVLAPESTTVTAGRAQIVTCNPTSLLDALVTQFRHLGRALGVSEDGDALAQQHLRRLQTLTQRAETLVSENGRRPRVLLVEWLDPLFLGSQGWMREIMEAAGGQVVSSLDTDTSVDAVVVALCGLSLTKTEQELEAGRVGSWWQELLDRHGAGDSGSAGRATPPVYLVDGTAMFTRPTPRLLLALEWLLYVLHEPESKWLKHSTFPFKRFEVSRCGVTETECSLSPELLEIEELHRQACARKQATYMDPATGYSVMTAYILKEKQVCCGNGCRHCPYGHVNVKDASRRKNTLSDTVFLQPRRRSRGVATDAPGGQKLWPDAVQTASEGESNADSADSTAPARELVVMFWSGGKDSFLALSYFYAGYAESGKPMPRVVLLTTVDPSTNTVPVQDIPVKTIVAQAEALELPLCLVAVGLDDGYTAAVREALQNLPKQLNPKRKQRKTRRGDQQEVTETTPATGSISCLVFGDLHLQDIRSWREQSFGMDYELRFPIWGKDYRTELLPTLSRLCKRTGASLSFSSVDKTRVGADMDWQVGQPYDWQHVEASNANRGDAEEPVDLMGECGEFHTCVKFPGMA